MKRIITISIALLSVFAASLNAKPIIPASITLNKTNVTDESADEIWKRLFDNGKTIQIDEVGEISAYALYDVDGDGINECFLKGEDDMYCMYCCGNGNGKADEQSVTNVMNSIPSTEMLVCTGNPFVLNTGSCGTGCLVDEYVKIEKSQFVARYMCVTTFGPDDRQSYECEVYKPNAGEAREMSYTLYTKSVPLKSKNLSIFTLDWKTIEKKAPIKPAESVVDAVPATFHYQNGDTVILKDQKGYFYQIMSNKHLGVAPGGAYSGDVVIPANISYDGEIYPVTTVRRGAMWKKPGASNIGNITSVTLPKSVTLVGSDAFRDNTSLYNVNYFKDTRIEVRSFWGCPSLSLKERPVRFAYTVWAFGEDYQTRIKDNESTIIYPLVEQNDELTEYQWAVHKYQHAGVQFQSWFNQGAEEAMECYCSDLSYVCGGMFKLRDINNVDAMFKGSQAGSHDVLLAHNNYVAKHEFLMFSRWVYGEEIKDMPAAFSQAMAKKYGRKVKYSHEAAHVLYTKTAEQLAVTEFEITNHEAMVVFSWVVGGKEVCSFSLTTTVEPGCEEWSIWNCDDDGTYGIPEVISITKDEKGNVELFLCHSAPESANFMHLVQKGGKFILEKEDQWYVRAL